MAIQVRNLSTRVEELASRTSDSVPVEHTPPPVIELPPPVITKEEVEIMKRQITDLTLKLTSYSKEIPVLETTLTHKLEHYALRLVKDRMDNMSSAPDIDAIQNAVITAVRSEIQAVKQDVASVRKEVAVLAANVATNAVASVALAPSSTHVSENETMDVNAVIENISNMQQNEDIELTMGPGTKKRTVRKKAVAVL